MREHDAQRLVDAEQMAGAREVGAVGERLAAPVARDGRARLGEAEEGGLVVERQPMIEQRDHHPCQPLAARAGMKIDLWRWLLHVPDRT